MIRFILFVIIFYLIFKVVRLILGSFSFSQKTKYNDRQNVSNDSKKSGPSIDKKDIIDAEFVEIKDDKDKAND